MNRITAPEYHPAETLRNRTFIGLLIAQFLAAFNDQAIHASAMFFAINKRTLTEAFAITLMPILFYAPWALFCTLAGYFADKYSKRFTLVFWKVVEIGITALAFLGFFVGSITDHPNWGSWLVLSTVFLMGTHSAFFVPAKYGAMPQILRSDLLSRGNGVLESLSFLATILGTVCGGFLSFYFKSQEYWIGVILMALAVIGAAASLMIRWMPAVNPNRKFPRWIYQPLWESLRSLLRSRPLMFALWGIAFFTFLVAYMRGAVYMLGETRIPRWNELQTSGVVAMTALGIGLGSPFAGWLSGRKVELGLVPLGTIGMIILICLAAVFLEMPKVLIVCITLTGFFTGFYLVPMFTLLQHRAPVERKGEVVATSNFVNVVGAMIASVLLIFVVFLAHHTGLAPQVEQVEATTDRTLIDLQQDEHHRPVYAYLEKEPGVVREIGKPHTPQEIKPFWKIDEELEPASGNENRPVQILISQRAQIQWHNYKKANAEFQNGLAPKPIKLRVSRYEINGIRHYYLRLVGEPLPPAYDNRHLPRYLFYGAAIMTAATLLLLVRLLPDLLKRTLWVIHWLRKERMRVFGIHHLPGHGPVILASNALTRDEQVQVAWSSDRQVHYLPTAKAAILAAIKYLDSGDVIAISLSENPAEADTFLLDLRDSLVSKDVPIVPIHVSHPDMKFGAPLPLQSSPEAIRHALEQAAKQAEE
ncbi:MAG TPA: MFS transporter [Gemmataceae bacterium]|nr:MFS transporter [Gemmataceae bacterium]